MNQFSPIDDSARSLRPPAKATARHPTKTARSNRLPATGKKHFVLDTNVLLHNPHSVDRFADNHVAIPVDVLSELDRFKNEQSDRGANARAIHRSLSATFKNTSGPNVTGGVPTAGGGTLRLLLFDPPTGSRKPAWFKNFKRVLPDLDHTDNRIIATALKLQSESSDPVILVTKDINLQLKAQAVGLGCEDYLNDKVEPSELRTYDLVRINVASTELQRFASSGSLDLPTGRIPEKLHLNQYVLLQTEEKKTMPARVHPDGIFRRLQIPKSLRSPATTAITPVNLGQQCLLDALLDPNISLVTCYGHAGTGKTLLSVAAGLSAVFDGTYRGLTVSRPVIAMGDTLGFLPGSLDEKMRPWLQPIYDALEFLMPPAAIKSTPKKKTTKKKPSDTSASTPTPGSKPYEPLIEQGVIEIEALCYIRGRSIPNRFFVLDEAQQLTPLEAKTIVTRMSKQSKLVMVGDPAQIDNP
ncbi:MAG: PhoH family protein, partial [Verrucomicrobiales bacterium]|nr:PhoH family protein [Verrucomicrobiales bacterium]